MPFDQALDRQGNTKMDHSATGGRLAINWGRLCGRSGQRSLQHFADVAQLAEQLFRKQQVGGSSPPIGSRIENAPG
jgi:predicted DNA-binding WGR domain protein